MLFTWFIMTEGIVILGESIFIATHVIRYCWKNNDSRKRIYAKYLKIIFDKNNPREN